MAVISAVSSLVNGNRQAKAVSQAADASIDFQREAVAQVRGDLEPWRQTGQNALMQIGNLSGANGAEAMQGAMGAFQASPGYQFRVQQGQQGIENSAASRGMLLSGSALKGVEAFRQGLAADEYGQFYNRLAGLAGAGQQAAAGSGSAGLSAAGAMGQAAMGQGNSLASIYAGQQAGINQGINNLGFAFGAGSGGGGAGGSVNPFQDAVGRLFR